MKSEIAVLIPHYNNPKGLRDSIMSINESIIVDVFIVDDGSKYKPNILNLKKEYSAGGCLKYIELESNQGIEYALNKGLKEIKRNNYPFIGRLDCGDFCIRDRFRKQINYLKQNSDIYLLGSWANVKDSQDKFMFILKHPENYSDIKKKMYLNSMFVHPSVVFRTVIIEHIGYYPTSYKAAEDYAYFFNIIKKFKSENFPEPLIDYVLDPNSISSKKRKTQVKSRLKIIIKHFYFGIYPIYGLFRNFLLLFMSREMSSSLKKLLKNDEKHI